jgi:membrane-associated phospholipid phosphatase
MASLPQAAPTAPARAGPPELRRVHRRRRPSGEPPPLPRHLARSGKWWLAAAAAVVVAWIVVWTTRGLWVFDVMDTRVLQGFAQVRSAPLTRIALAAGALATPIAVYVLWVANFAALIVFRRWRHLFVWAGVGLLVVTFGGNMLETLQRPRPYEVELLGRWAGYSMPSLPVTVLTAFLVSTLYSLVPAGRPRTRGKWVLAVVLAVTVLSRLYLAQDHPTDVVAGVIIGVAIPLAAFRLLTPNEVYPVRYRRGRTAHLDVTGPRGGAIIRALQDQLGLLATSVKPFNL